MGSPVTLDANVVIGFLDPDDALHEAAHRALAEVGDAPKDMPTTAYAESLVRGFASGHAEVIERFIERAGIEVVAVDRPTARYGAELRARFTAISIADAIVLAFAVRRGRQLITFDADLGVAAGRIP